MTEGKLKKYLLVGEVHGTHECPEAFYTIIRGKGYKTVALEFPSDYQGEIDPYLKYVLSINQLSSSNMSL